MIVSTTLFGEVDAEKIGKAINSISPHVDKCLLIDTRQPGIDTGYFETFKHVASVYIDKIITRSWPWQNDFAAARNESLRFATDMGAAWAITVDSDEWIEGGEDIRPVLSFAQSQSVYMKHVSNSYSQPRAIRLPCKEQWTGRVHEAITLSGPEFESVKFCDSPKTDLEMLSKRTRDLDILNELILEKPNEPRWMYYLADALAGLGRNEEAVTRFVHRVKMKGWNEEAAWAAYRGAEILTSTLERHDDAIELCALGLARHAGIPELAWMAALSSWRAKRPAQAVYWARLAEVHGYGGADNGRAERERILFRVAKGLREGPCDVLQYALREIGDNEGADRAAEEFRRLSIA